MPTMAIVMPEGYWNSNVQVDPFPAYPHDVKLVQQTARGVARAFPMKQDVTIVVLHYESIKRTNGECEIHNNYDKEKPYPWMASIRLWGKRIPPHPAMTRYLVAHEYGHAVAKAVSFARGEDTDDQLLKEYTRLRGLKGGAVRGEGGTWHRAIGELFANDFRLLRTGVEAEFWPHPGIPRPNTIKAIVKFWETVVV